MEGEQELKNGTLRQDAAETIVMIPADTQEKDMPAKPPSFHKHRLRSLAIFSIICGCSCIGVLALIYAVKASEKQKAGSQVSAADWARRSRRLSVLSISVWVSLIILVPVSVYLISYLLTQAE
ncbi:transmembrane protein 265 [Zootoca vivipara]|uniref:transmembrane protein 265 n=1 Tax=Zootoca vivipara TaxID=8524 RepID=UPI001590AE46|nr:transmembrane protein 265 [Zootoca vivipara]